MRCVLGLILLIIGTGLSARAVEILKSPDALLWKQDLLQGSVWVRNAKKYTLNTPYGSVQANRGDFYIHYEPQKVTVVNNLGRLQVHLKDGRIVEVPPGFEMWFSEIQEDKKNRMGVIRPVNTQEYIVNLGKIWTGSLASFKKEMLEMEESWGDRTRLASRYYKSLVEREIASVEKEKQEQDEIKRKEQERREANRRLLFHKAFER